MQVIPYDPRHESELISFAEENFWITKWPRTLIERFLHELTSGPEMIFDVREHGEPVAFAALVDRVENPANEATFELLGLAKGVKPEQVLDLLLPLARQRVPVSKSGFSLGFPADFAPLEELTKRHGLAPHYEMYDMLNPAPKKNAADHGFAEATSADDAEIYRVLRESFRENPDTALSSFADWQKGRARETDRMTWIQREGGKIVAFLHLARPSTDAEINVVGVLPEHRGKGIARRLIAHALACLAARDAPGCRLSVAVQNKAALRIYQGLGFEVKDLHRIFRWRRS